MRIAFFLDNSHIPSIDFSQPENGNPGVGACEYLHVAIPYFINKYCRPATEAVIIAPHVSQLPNGLIAYQAASVTEAATKAKNIGVDYFIFRPRINEEDHILDHIDRLQLPSIGRAALTPHPHHLRRMARSKYFKSLVCVGREQYDSLVDSPLWSKLSYIDNGIHVNSCAPESTIETKDPRFVTYMGALVPMKGFHVLAEAWPKVLRQFPDAKLSVIGSVKMYGDNLSVGPLGIASKDYEQQHIIPHLCDAYGHLHPSVTFHGQMGKQKFSILRKSSVGVVNPTGQTETCCVSAVEISACRTAVVSGAYYALLDTVLDEKTGLLGRGIDQLAQNICRCLDNPDLAKKLGDSGYKRVSQQYDFSAVAPKWDELFRTLQKNSIPRPTGKLKNIFYHYKLLRIINSIPQRLVGQIFPWPSLFEVQAWIQPRLTWIKSLKYKF
jgi:glycosyltransferase involved in cell wall biosynthesis